MSEEQAPKCPPRCPLCGKYTRVPLGAATFIRCSNKSCSLSDSLVNPNAFNEINTRLAEAGRANGESIGPALLKTAENKVAQLKERGFRFTGYLMYNDIMRCTVDSGGRVEWPDFQPQAEAERLRSKLSALQTRIVEYWRNSPSHGAGTAYERIWRELDDLLKRTEAADETENKQ